MNSFKVDGCNCVMKNTLVKDCQFRKEVLFVRNVSYTNIHQVEQVSH